jgi:glycosyltransferase involved in cell wall biosynthesis
MQEADDIKNTSMDKVSVIVPVFNNELHLQEAVNSILEQTYRELEILIIDDCSTDRSREIIEDLTKTDNRIKPIYLSKNSGAAAARNEGIKQSTGRYIAFLDSDDLWLPQKLEKQIEFAKANMAPLTFTSYQWKPKEETDSSIINSYKSVNYKNLLKYNCIGCLTAMYDTQICGKQYMPNTPQRHDWGLWLAITRQFGPAKGLEEVHAIYRTGHNSLSSNKWKSAKYNWVILREYEHQSLISAVYYYLYFVVNKTLKYIRLK